MNKKARGGNMLKIRNMLFYDSKFGHDNIHEKVFPFDYIAYRFGLKTSLSRVIEVGCGTASCLLSLKCNEKVGLDISRVNLIIAKKRYPNLMLVQGDSDNIPFKEVFDGCLIVDLLHHIRFPHITIRQVEKITRPGGVLFIFDTCVDGVKPIYPIAIFLQKISEKIGYNIENFGPELKSIECLLKQGGFRIVKKFGEGSFIRYLNSALNNFSIRVNFPLRIPPKVSETLDKFFEHFFRKFPIKFGIVAIKESCL